MSIQVGKYLPFFIDDILRWKDVEKLDDSVIRSNLLNLSNIYRGLLVFGLENQNISLLSNVDAENQSLRYRASVYHNFFKEIFCDASPKSKYTFGVYADDGDLPNVSFPIFSFQKEINGNNMLIPDIDFFLYNFYESVEFVDNRLFDDKACKAIFVGSTTGAPLQVVDGNPMRTITEKHLLSGEVQRVRSALNFRGSSDVYFDLPVIVQFDNQATFEKLAAMGFGTNKKIALQEQLANKFIISMDGNGATCARIVNSLKSNSVLMKYKSNSMLFYFSALHAWEHYIPIDNDSDVVEYLTIESKAPGYFSYITQNANRFYNDYLTKQHIYEYTRCALRLYESIVVK
ncbi:hypothetical protein MMB17_17655 [Methylobacterium organophilum]|uniref:glycosyl transferase family 90 n=1 Tax=Methylobacterium organophilum TaxID=410 RepID=UPI001F1331B9|nr:glycosyl transferase family 90 [Methylobacterium organophilum]UMY16506.1 hypothetical protein MMB17_17655 [Methylobacterium organophilum]